MNPTLASLIFAATVTTLSAQQMVPDFRLQDVNFRSPRYDTDVSPRDYQLQVSGYYFGAAH